MGFLIDLRKGRRDWAGTGFGVIFFWFFVGALFCGFAGATLFHSHERAVLAGAAFGSIAGCAIGFYASWGTSAAARLLALPGRLLAFVVAPFTLLEFYLFRRSGGGFASGSDLPSRTLRDLTLTHLPCEDINALVSRTAVTDGVPPKRGRVR